MLLFSLLAGTRAPHTIEIHGNKRIEKEAIKSYIADEVFSNPDALNAALKKLYETGYFKDVKLSLKNGVLVVDVIEQPIINKVAFEGNNHIGADAFKQLIDITTGQAFSDFKVVDEATQKIEAMYRASGYMNTKVLVQVRPVSEGRVDVVFKIVEGRRAFIKSIKFIGNTAFTDHQLQQRIESKVYSGFKFLSNSHYFSTELLQQDYMKLQEYYHNNGYPDATVTSLSSELKRDQSGFDLVFSIKQGAYYDFGEIKLESQHPQKIDIETLKIMLPIHKGEMFNKSLLDSTEEWLNDELNKLHISTADVEITPKKNGKYIDLEIVIKKGGVEKVRFIHIKGNRRTYSRVIRGNLEVAEGNFLNKYKLKQSEYNLQGLDYFSKVSVMPREVNPHLYDIEISVDEKSTGNTAFQIGYGTYDGLLAQIQWMERNIGGTGNAMQGALMIANENQELQFTLINSSFLGMQDVTGSASVSFDRLTRLENRNTLQGGLSFSLGYSLGKYLYQRFEYSVGVDHITLKDGKSENISDLFSRIGKGEDPSFNNTAWGEKEGYLGLGGAFPTRRIGGDKGRDIFNSSKFGKDVTDPFKWIRENPHDDAAYVKNINESPKLAETKKAFLYLRDHYKQNLKNWGDKTKIPNRVLKDKELEENDLGILRQHLLRNDLALELLEDDLGTRVYSTLSHSFVLRPFKYTPNRKFSFEVSMNNSIAGIFGSVRYLKNSFSIKHIFRLPLHMQLKTTANLGFINQIGDHPLRLQDCMSLSSMVVKGFALEGLTPRDSWSGGALRGTKYYYGGIELKIPLFDPQSYGVNVGAYLHFGNVWDSKFKSKEAEHPGRYLDGDWTKIRVTAGGFAALRIPMLPLRFDYTWVLKKEEYDREQRFMVGVDM